MMVSALGVALAGVAVAQRVDRHPQKEMANRPKTK
jgi:hypothetical protein